MHHYWVTTINQASGTQKSYKIFNENYKSKLEIKKEKEGIFQNLKKLLY